MAEKRKVALSTIANDPQHADAVAAQVALMLKKMWEFSFESEGNNKSSTKTDQLHSAWQTIFQTSLGSLEPQYKASFGTIIETVGHAGKTNRIMLGDIFKADDGFNVDVVVEQLISRSPRAARVIAVHLLKAPLTSINKNSYNSAGSVYGEICRFFGNDDNRNTDAVFITFVPRETFVISEKTGAVKVEKVLYRTLTDMAYDKRSTVKDKLPFDPAIKQRVHSITIRYDLVLGIPLQEITTKSQLLKLIQSNGFAVKNVDLDELKDYIEHFVTEHSAALGLLDLKAPEPLVPTLSEATPSTCPPAA